MFFDAVRYVTFMFLKLYILELLRCDQLCFVTLHHVAFRLCRLTLSSNITMGACLLETSAKAQGNFAEYSNPICSHLNSQKTAMPVAH